MSKSLTPIPQSNSSQSLRRGSGISTTSADIHTTGVEPCQKKLISPEPPEIRRHSTKSQILEVQSKKAMSSFGKSASVDTGKVSRESSQSPLHEPSMSDPMLSESITTANLTVPETIANLRRSSSSILGKLHILVRSAEGLTSMDSTGDTNPFVRCFLLPNTTLGGKRKSIVSERTLDPVWEEELVYNMVKLDDLTGSRVLEVSIWDMDRRGTNSFMGGIRLGPEPHPLGSNEGPDWMDSVGEEVSQWEKMLANPGEWVEFWHDLRPSLTSLHTLHRTKQGATKPLEDTDDIGEAPLSPEQTDLQV